MALGTRTRKQGKQRTYGGPVIAEKPMVGPESGGIQFCLKCHRSILRGEHWRKVWAADGSYAVGIHDVCRVVDAP